MLIQEVITRTRLYHGSGRYFPNGFVLRPQSDGYTNWPEVQETELLVEKYRPPSCLPRNQSVFMLAAKSIGRMMGVGAAASDYVYLVEPIDRVERNDHYWYGQVELSLWEPDDPEAKQYAENYWRGVRSPKPNWEYRAPSARIVQIVVGERPEWFRDEWLAER